MRKVKTASFIAMSTVMLYGCGNSAPPECDNAEVLGLVTEIFHNHIRDQLVPLAIMQVIGVHPSMFGDATYASFKATMAEDPQSKQVVDYIDGRLATVPEIRYEGIRTIKRDTETHRSTCAAQLRGGDTGQADAHYTAQWTDDGRLYVEARF